MALAQPAVTTTSASTTSHTATYGSAVTPGSVLVACIGTVGTSTPITSVSDGVNGAWSVGSAYTVDSGVGYGIVTYYFANTGAGTPTVTVAQSSNPCTLTILEFSGVAIASPVDTSGVYTPVGGVASPVSISLTTTQASDLIVAYANAFDATHTITQGAGYTAVTGSNTTINGGSNVLAFYNLNAGASGSKTVDFSWNNGNSNVLLTAAAFKIASAVGPSSFSKPMWPMSFF